MPKLFLGGQAVVEGVMMRTKSHYAVAVRRPDGKVTVKLEAIRQLPRLLTTPFLRGTAVLYETLSIGTKALLFSANEASGEKEELGGRAMLLTFLVAGVFAILLFVALPLFLASVLADGHQAAFNILDGVFRVLVFVSYLLVISRLRDVRRMFQYHGAEHMAVHAHEHGKRLVPAEIRKFPTMHPRCGTSFLLIVLLVSIAVFSFITHENLVVQFVLRLMLLPVVAGISYEFLRVSAKVAETPLGRVMAFPGVALQHITTKQPDGRQVEVAVAALRAVMKTYQK